MVSKLVSLRQNKKGFTLVEMLVVIAIIAVLVAIIIPVMTSSTVKAKAATDAANLRSIKAEASILYLGNNDYTAADYAAKITDQVISKSDNTLTTIVIYQNGDAIDTYYTNAGKTTYYSIAAFTASAQSGEKPTGSATTPTGTLLGTLTAAK